MAQKFVLLISILFLCSISARADSIITVGGVTLSRPTGTVDQVTSMGFSGDGFSIGASARTSSNNPLPCAFGCSPNTLLNLSATAGFWTVGDITNGSMNINGTNYFFVTGGVGPPSLPNVWGTGSLTLGAGSVLIPDTNDPIITLTSTFGMFGSINGTYNTGNVPSGQLFGAGTVTVTLRPSMFVPGQYVAERATYTFVQPTPEPATLILFGSGALGLIGAKLRRRH